MTIAACYLSSEGIVLGADSTSTMWVSNPDGLTGGLHHLNYAQKIFEVGKKSTLGVTMWGMGCVGGLSHRTLIAQFADDLVSRPVTKMQEVADRFSEHFWSHYTKRLAKPLARHNEIYAKPCDSRTDDEKTDLEGLAHSLSGGFCLGGHLTVDRSPDAFEIAYTPQLNAPPVPSQLRHGSAYFWGCPNIIQRVLFGIDERLFSDIKRSGKWSGTDDDLFNLIRSNRLAQPFDLPLRESVDWVHTVVYTTIKAMKFSHQMPVCGGPIEIAVISTDRLFRWVRHKDFDAALR
jgi:hypothetical protein